MKNDYLATLEISENCSTCIGRKICVAKIDYNGTHCRNFHKALKKKLAEKQKEEIVSTGARCVDCGREINSPDGACEHCGSNAC